ncbi:MAG TPA: DpnI domain-containing protein [Anaerolineales bacterium]|nr:DpnI domain-containing protein [Anaerolineales bacterium]
MKLNLASEIAKSYSNPAQRIRVMTEEWVSRAGFCPNCGRALSQFENNKPVADFYCGNCSEEYELKSKNGNVGKKILDGAYATMIERLNSENNPNFFFLTYDKSTLEIRNFLTIPKYFFVPSIIEKRKALASTARRAGWVGCNIDVSNVPEMGKIFFVQNGVARNKDEVLDRWSKTEFIKSTGNIEAKGWLLDVLLCVERIKKREFSLDDVYAFEGYLKAKHPSNNRVKAKIRQQLQFLRDRGVVRFLGRGRYRVMLASGQ